MKSIESDLKNIELDKTTCLTLRGSKFEINRKIRRVCFELYEPALFPEEIW